ncbi:hypothetical protein ACHAXH_002081 [Discostella pseudostelligera]
MNNLPSLSLYVTEKSRGRKGPQKRKWGVEMNQAREIYLKHYSGVDSLDHMIQNTGIWYITWKFWHSVRVKEKDRMTGSYDPEYRDLVYHMEVLACILFACIVAGGYCLL